MFFALFTLALARRPKIRVTRKLKDSDCDLCRWAVTYIASMLSDQKTVDEITRAVEQACLYVEEDVRDICDAIVEEWIPPIVSYIQQEMSANDICALLGIC